MFTLKKALSYTRPNGECLEWTRCLNSDGYARAKINDNVNGKVHRFVFEEVNGYAPPVVRHSCDNPRCINPEHLVAGNNIDNIKDRNERKRTYNYVSEEDKEAVRKLRAERLTHRQIAESLNIKTKRVERILSLFGG